MQYILSEKESKEYNEFKELKEKPVAYCVPMYGRDYMHDYFHITWWRETEATQFLKDEIKKIEQSRDRLSQMVKDLEKELKAKKETPAKKKNNIFSRWI